jgi:hypothetical protein
MAMDLRVERYPYGARPPCTIAGKRQHGASFSCFDDLSSFAINGIAGELRVPLDLNQRGAPVKSPFSCLDRPGPLRPRPAPAAWTRSAIGLLWVERRRFPP